MQRLFVLAWAWVGMRWVADLYKGKKKGVSWLQTLGQKKKRGWEVKKANNNLKTNEVSASKSEISSGLLLFPFFFFFNIVDLFMRNNIFIYQDANANFPCIILPLQFVKNF